MTAELVTYQQPSTLGEQMDFARAVVQRPEGGAQSLLPQAYRDNPANVLLAVGLGSSMGLSPAESLYRIDVIQGKPCASAELISANVRKAGHRLRVHGDDQSCTATIIRADDPEFEFTVTRDVAWAQAMGLTTKDNYKKQRGTMLQWRAITAVARLACPEALYGVSYTPDEMYDQGDRPGLSAVEPPPAAARMGAILHVEQEPDDTEPNDEDAAPLLDPQSALAKRMFATFREVGIDDKPARLEFIAGVIGRDIASSSEMTEAEASRTIDALTERLENPFPADPA
jgi:hypothetical protein